MARTQSAAAHRKVLEARSVYNPWNDKDALCVDVVSAFRVGYAPANPKYKPLRIKD
jgi:hypothetical protein